MYGSSAEMYTHSSIAEEAYITYWASVTESSEGVIISKLLKGNTITWNTGCKVMFGNKANEAIGNSMNMLISELLMNVEKLQQEKLHNNEMILHFEKVRIKK